MTDSKTRCIRCDAVVATGLKHGVTLTFEHETGAVKVCDECASTVKQRDHWQ